jgi:lysyl-tRNA synthetase class 1
MTDDALRSAAHANKTWVFEEARKLLVRYPDGKPQR